MVSNLIKGTIVSIGIFGLGNVGKCSLLKQLTIDYGNIADPYNFNHNDVHYHSFPIPCTQPDYDENYNISIGNCDIAILMTDPHCEGEINREFYAGLIRDSYLNSVLKVIVCFNKCDLNKDSQSLKIKKVIGETDQQMKLIYTQSLIDIVYIDISVKQGIGIDSLLHELANAKLIINQNEPNVLLSVHDAYEDNEDCKMVISGKILQGKKLSLDTVLMHSSIKPIEICNCFGEYVNSVSIREFVTLKFDLKQFKEDIPNFNKTFLVTSPQNQLPKFKLIEALIVFTTIPCSIISQGFKSVFKSGAVILECSFEKISKEVPMSNEQTQLKARGKTFIAPELNTLFKVMINLKEDIRRDKYETNIRIGSFGLFYEGKAFAYGKIVKYKPSI